MACEGVGRERGLRAGKARFKGMGELIGTVVVASKNRNERVSAQ
jgi:hypothetical protein